MLEGEVVSLRKNLSIVLLIGFSLFSLCGCGDFQFLRVKEVTDDNIEKEVMSAYRPVVLLVHRNLSSSGTHKWGPLLERMAKAFPDDVYYYRYEVDKNDAWFRKMGMRFVGVVHLINRGKLVSSIGSSVPQEDAQLAQLFLLIDKHILPNKRFDGFRAAVDLKPQYFQTDVIEAEKPVVIAFDKCTRGG